MRPLSVTSDLRDAIAQACSDAADCGLDLDQIRGIVRDELAVFEEAWIAEAKERAGYPGQ